MGKVLLYAFTSFGKYNKNISAEVLRGILDNENLKKVVLGVKFDVKAILNKLDIDGFKPDVIIGMGQYPKGDKIRIETLAKNIKRSKSIEASEIIPGAPETLSTTLGIEPNEISEITTNAGTYVCNFSMYVILNKLQDTDTKFAFLHIPKDLDESEVINFIKLILEDSTSSPLHV